MPIQDLGYRGYAVRTQGFSKLDSSGARLVQQSPHPSDHARVELTRRHADGLEGRQVVALGGERLTLQGCDR